MINKIRTTQNPTLNLKKLALASGLTIATAVSVPSCVAAKAKNNIKQLPNTSVVQTNQLKSLERDEFMANYKNYDNNNQTINNSSKPDTFRAAEEDSITQIPKVQTNESDKTLEKILNIQDNERIEINENQIKIKNEIYTNIKEIVNLNTGTFESRKEYHNRLSELIKDAIDLRLKSIKNKENTTDSEEKIISALIHRASKYNNEEQFKQKMEELFNSLDDTEKEIYQTVRYNDNYRIHVGKGAPKELVKYEVKKQFGDYSSEEQDELETFINDIINTNTVLAIDRKIKNSSDIDLSPIDIFVNKEVQRQMFKTNETKKDERNAQRAKVLNRKKHSEKAADALRVTVGTQKADEIIKKAEKTKKDYNYEDYLKGK